MNPRRVLAGIRWYLRELTGATAYENYVQAHRRRHPQAPVLSRPAFERMRVDRQDAAPGSRCC